MDLIHLKQEPGLVQHVQGEPALLVKEEILVDSTQDGNELQSMQGTPTPAGTGIVDEACSMSLGDFLNVKQELSDMDIGSTVLQHMDIYYTINQNSSAIAEENTIADVCNKPMMPYNQGIKQENVEDKLTDSSSKQPHISEEHKNQRYRCNKCVKVFKSQDCRNQHVKEVHGTLLHKCTQCNKEFNGKLYLSRHIYYTHSKGKHECEICKKMCKSRGALRSHVSNYHRNKAADSSSKPLRGRIEELKRRVYRCNECLKVFKHSGTLWQHRTQIHGTESHKCAQCNKEFKCKQYLSIHIRRTHGKGKPECNICKTMCKSQRSLFRHVLLLHQDSSSKQDYKCNKCLKVFKSKRLLTQHTNVVHGTGSHKCTQCDKEFKCKVYLIRHIRYTHSKGQYECDICKKMFKLRMALLKHVSCFHLKKPTDSPSKHVHGSEEPEHKGYMCNICMKVFKTEEYRNKHIILIHGTETHKCTECNKEFKCKQYLTGHVRYAHSKQQHECEICKKMCTSRGALYNHFAKVHRKKSAGRKPGNRGVATPSMVSSVSVAACTADPSSEPTIKQESGDTDLDIGPTVLQHMDSHYTLNQVKVEHMKMESSPLTDEQIVKKEPNWSM